MKKLGSTFKYFLYFFVLLGFIVRISLLLIIKKLKILTTLQLQFRLFLLKKNLSYKKLIVILMFLSSPLLYNLFIILADVPDISYFTNRTIESSTKIYDRNGNLLYKIYKDKNRTYIPFDQIPKVVIQATLAAEDADFYNHRGFSIKGITRSFIKNIRQGKLTGGSTITQQLVKNTILDSQKTISRKIKELILSIQIETKYTKNEILEMYLNEVSFGHSAYGIEEASATYFGKKAKDLTLEEAALLSGLPKAPTRFSPFGSNPQLAFSRQREVLSLMRQNNFITEEEEKKAVDQKINFTSPKTEIKAPHFVMYIKEKLVEMYGEEMVEKNGLNVYTSLDLNIQNKSEEIINKELEKIKNLNIGNAASIVISPKNGEILAMVGSKNYFDTKNDGNVNVALRPRSPGSSIKILTYAQALSESYSLASFISDSPVRLSIPNQKPYTPKNYDNKYRGMVTIRNALAQSLNIPAVKLIVNLGVHKIIDLGKKFGITTWNDKDRFGPSLTLGGGEVKLIELAYLYAGFANYGAKIEPKPILKITDFKGKTIFEDNCTTTCEKTQIIDPRIAYLIIDTLKDNDARAATFGRISNLNIAKHPEVAVKTGTSNDLRDNLTVGFNQDYLTAVWVGNNDNSPMKRVASGITGAAPIWANTMTAILAESKSQNWEIPPGLINIPFCGSNKTEWFLEEKRPIKNCQPIPVSSPSAIPKIL